MTLAKSALMLAFATGMSCSLPAFADTSLNITGTIKASPCSVDGDTGSGIDVDLGQGIEASNLATASSGSTWKQFNISLSNCPATTSSVTATFTGTAATESSTLYKSTGTSSSVQVELQDQSGNNLGNGKTLQKNVDSTAHTAIFPLQARAYSSAGGATPGTVATQVLVAMAYQ